MCQLVPHSRHLNSGQSAFAEFLRNHSWKLKTSRTSSIDITKNHLQKYYRFEKMCSAAFWSFPLLFKQKISARSAQSKISLMSSSRMRTLKIFVRVKFNVKSFHHHKQRQRHTHLTTHTTESCRNRRYLSRTHTSLFDEHGNVNDTLSNWQTLSISFLFVNFENKKKRELPVAVTSSELSFSPFSSDEMLLDFGIALVTGVDDMKFERLLSAGVSCIFGVPVTTCSLTLTVLMVGFMILVANLCVEFLIADFSRCRWLLFDPAILALVPIGGVVKSIKYIDLLKRPPGVGVVGDFKIANEADLAGLFSFWSICWNATLDGVKQIVCGVPGCDWGLYAADSRLAWTFWGVFTISDATYEVSIICDMPSTNESFDIIESLTEGMRGFSSGLFGVVDMKLHASSTFSVNDVSSIREFSSFSSTNECTELFLLSLNELSFWADESKWSLQRGKAKEKWISVKFV